MTTARARAAPRVAGRARATTRRTTARATRVVDADAYAREVARRLVAQHDAAATMRGAVYDGALDVIVRVNDARCAPVMRLYDRGFTRGHAVFDACTVHEGRCHLLAAHLRRFARSAREAGVGEMNDEALATMEALVLEVVARGGVTHGQVRMYATSGCESENFSLCGATDSPPTYYVVAYEKDPDAWMVVRGLTASSSPVPIKPPRYATLKSTNYLPNVNVAQIARGNGVDVGVFLTQDGMIGEGPGANVAFLTPDGTLRTPPATNVLGGITIQRLRELIETESNRKALRKVGIKRFDDSQPLSPFVVLGADEAMLVGSAVGVQGIISWDGRQVGDGRVGPATCILAELLLDDMKSL
jgi:4-amino-4-deoxychorismate lyase